MLTDIKKLEYTLSADELESIKQFYKKSWELDTNYIAYGDIKSMQFNQMIFSHHYKDAIAKQNDEYEKLKDIRENKFITTDGIFTKVPEFARTYISSNEFPTTSIIYLITECGDKFAEFFYTLKGFILNEIKAIGYNADADEVENKLFESVRVYTYIKKDEDLIIETTLENKIEYTLLLDDSKYYRYLFDFNRVLSDCDKYQTLEFYPSFFIDYSNYDFLRHKLEEEFNCRHWCYDFKPMSFYDQFIIGEDGIKGYYGISVISGSRLRYSITPYIMWDRFSKKELDNLCDAVLDEMKGLKTEKYTKLVHILTSNCEYNGKAKLRLLCTIFSIALFSHTIHSIRGKLGKIEYNLKTVALYFGTQHETIEALESIYCNRGLCDTFVSMFVSHIKNLESTLCDEFVDGINYSSTSKIEELISNMRCKYYETNKDRKITNREYADKSSYHIESIGINDYIRHCKEDAKITTVDKLILLIMMLKSGYIDIIPDYNTKKSDFRIATTESAKILIFKPYYRFIPALNIVENGKMTKEIMLDFARDFGKYLVEKGEEIGLDKDLEEFIKKVYNAGIKLNKGYSYGCLWLDIPNIENGIRTVKEWNKQEWSADDLYQFKYMSSELYSEFEENLQNKYVGMAKEFMNNNVY